MGVELAPDLDTRFADAGVAIIEHALTVADLTAMDRVFPVLSPGSAGARTMAFAPDDFGWLAEHGVLAGLAGRLGGRPMELVRALALDKSPQSNWFVPWHQDRADDGAEPPPDELARIVALRVHLDDCDEDNGPLEVLPGTHMPGRLSHDDVLHLTGTVLPLLCLTVRGDILAMRPLLLHRSQRARKPTARRVLHLEWAPVGERLL